MNLNEKIQYWKNEIERAKEYGFYFDTQTMSEVVQTVEELRAENARLNILVQRIVKLST